MDPPATLSYYTRQLALEKDRLLAQADPVLDSDSDLEETAIDPVLSVLETLLTAVNELKEQVMSLSEDEQARDVARGDSFKNVKGDVRAIREVIMETLPALRMRCEKGVAKKRETVPKIPIEDKKALEKFKSIDISIKWPILDEDFWEINEKILKYSGYKDRLSKIVKDTVTTRELKNLFSRDLLNGFSQRGSTPRIAFKDNAFFNLMASK